MDSAVLALEIAKEYDLAVCSGHLSIEESCELFAQAKHLGIERLILTHPLQTPWQTYSHSQIHRMVDMGAYCELCFGGLMPRAWAQSIRLHIRILCGISERGE